VPLGTTKIGDIIMPPKRFKPDQIAEKSAQYKNTTTKTEVTVVKNEPFPPTPGKNQYYVLVDKTKHKMDKRR